MNKSVKVPVISGKDAMELFRFARLGKDIAEVRQSEPEIAKVISGIAEAAQVELSDDNVTPLRDLPTLQPALDLGRLHAWANAVNLAPDKIDALAEILPSPDAATDDVLERLVVAGKLEGIEAVQLGAGRVTFLLADDDEALTSAIAGKNLADLLAMRPAEWRQAIETSGTKTPAGHDASSWAAELARRHAALAPTKAFHGRLCSKLASLEKADAHRIILAWPGFELKQAVEQVGGDVKAQFKSLKAKLAPVLKLQQLFPDTDWLTFDYSPGSDDLNGLNLQKNFGEKLETALLTSLKAHQRIHAISGDVDTSIQLLEAGYHSAYSIAKTRLKIFIDQSGLPPEEAERVHASSVEILGTTANMTLAVHGVVNGVFDKLPVGNLVKDARDYLARIQGYTTLFGNQAWCDCKDCGSILSPAAYFVDLMTFVDDEVRSPMFTRGHPGHVLDLKERRPDLWTLPLTCKNTDTPVPTLDLINEVLENYVAKDSGFQGDLTDRAVVETHVYKTVLYNSNQIAAFDQPFCLPYERVSRLLAQAGRSRADVAAVNGGSQAWQWLALSDGSRAMVFESAEKNLPLLRRVFGVPIAANGAIGPVDVPPMLQATGLTRDELGQVIAAKFVKGRNQPRIVAGKANQQSVQNDIERVQGLTPGMLDRLHRFVRLARAAGLIYRELDVAMQTLGLSRLDAAAGEQMAGLLSVRKRTGADLEDALALCGKLPTLSMEVDGISLFDRRFNVPALLALGGKLPQQALRFVLPAYRAPDAAANPMTARLCAGLSVDEADLSRLVIALAVPLACVDQATGFDLTQAHLDLLYRHARLARALKLSVAELLQLLTLVDGLAKPWLSKPGDVDVVLNFVDTWREGRRTLDALAHATGKEVRDPAAWPEVPAVRVQVRVDSSNEALASRLNRVLRMDAAKAAAILNLAWSAARPPLPVDQWTDLTDDDLDKVLDTVLRLSTLLAPVEIDAEAVKFIAAHRAVFRLDGLPEIPEAAVWSVDLYTRFTRAPDVARGEAETVLSQADFHALLTAHTPQGFPAGEASSLARVLRVDISVIATLRSAVKQVQGQTALEHLRRVERAAHLARALGVSGEILPLLQSNDVDKLAVAADALVAGFRLRYPDEATATAQLEPVDDAIRSLKRDALCTHLLRAVAPKKGIPWRNRSDLYHYFLLDVEMGGCGRTSRLSSAISSVQLYVHRIRMNLEQDGHAGGQADRVHVMLEPAAAQQWEWRQNYRVWEANRKVFLWPENYLEPDLRDDKTEQFIELESNLLQQEINEQNVLDAYTRYVAGFEEVAKLHIGGCWYESGPEDRLHLFGATSSDPPIWYYRHVDNLRNELKVQNVGVRWSPWVKVDVQIPVREVSPVIFEGRLHVFWVEIRTRSINKIEGGSSTFVGYDHTMRLKFTTLRADGRWTAPQEVSLKGWPEGNSAGLKRERNSVEEQEKDPVDDYTLNGYLWERICLDVIESANVKTLVATGYNNQYQAELDLFGRRIANAKKNRIADSTRINEWSNIAILTDDPENNKEVLQIGSVSHQWGRPNASYAQLVNFSAFSGLLSNAASEFFIPGQGINAAEYEEWFGKVLPIVTSVASISKNTLIHEVPRSFGPPREVVIQMGVDQFLFQTNAKSLNECRLIRIGTTLAERISRKLFSGGAPNILSIGFQENLSEARPPLVALSNKLEIEDYKDGTEGAKALLNGPMGAWYSELFMQIPWRIALHLNAQGRFEAAQRWFHYLFDPTASDGPGPDRVWRYIGFRELGITSLKDMLTDKSAIEAYKNNPFNPHAIARLRPSAYQKNLVMRYVDNLLDWADSLFTEFSTESINEATMLYVLAGDILGERPARLADCGPADPAPRNYETIRQLMDKESGSEFLIELQTWSYSGTKKKKASRSWLGQFGADSSVIATAKDEARKPAKRASAFRGPAPKYAAPRTQASQTQFNDRGAGIHLGSRAGIAEQAKQADLVAWGLVRQISPAFCVPPNKTLLDYWDRVADRLGKIRSCRDINGVSRMPPLFAPAIDTQDLERARALGLSLDDVLKGAGASLPPYRFVYLIEKAKAMATTVSSFGNALLAALEKRDTEQLSRLQLIQQQNIAKMTSSQRRWELTVAEESLAAVDRQIEAATYRKEFYNGLKEDGRSIWEIDQAKNMSHSIEKSVIGTALSLSAAIAYLVPQLGAPTAIKYGGKELGDSLSSVAGFARDYSSFYQAIASSDGFEAGIERRDEDWTHQRTLATHELNQLKHQRQIAVLHRDIAARALDIHTQSIAQIEELFDFYDNKFTGEGLHTWLATQLQRLHLGAYSNALALARLAEEAYRYERGTTESMISESYWDASRSGLGAGDQLLHALQTLERRFIETDFRSHEINQSFSLRNVAPAALVQLRESGTCEFDLAEIFFDLAYPGHYRRRIKAVRLSIPCVTGPYVNVSAVLTMRTAQIRSNADDVKPIAYPVQRTKSVATSSAQNDAGVFELAFRDERYLPFEGAGAISRWKLELPSSFRAFDYGSISDVILSMSYTAEFDDGLRDRVQSLIANAERTITAALQKESMSRLFSVRQEFPSAYHRLMQSPLGTSTSIDISDSLLPYFLVGHDILVESAVLAVEPTQVLDGINLTFKVDDGQVLPLTAQADLASLPGAPLPEAFRTNFKGVHQIALLAEAPGLPEQQVVGLPPLNSMVKDILLYVRFKLA